MMHETKSLGLGKRPMPELQKLREPLGRGELPSKRQKKSSAVVQLKTVFAKVRPSAASALDYGQPEFGKATTRRNEFKDEDSHDFCPTFQDTPPKQPDHSKMEVNMKVKLLRREIDMDADFRKNGVYTDEVKFRQGPPVRPTLNSEFECQFCNRKFNQRWKANRHAGRCRDETTGHLNLKRDGLYTCRICGIQFTDNHDFKQHSFYSHQEREVKIKYQVPLEKLIGLKYLFRLRQRLLRIVQRGELASFMTKCMCKYTNLMRFPINYEHTIAEDPDPVNRQRRINLYYKKRDLLLKMAVKETTKDETTSTVGNLGQTRVGSELTMRWNLMINEEEEEIVDRILVCLRVAVTTANSNPKCFPNYTSFTKTEVMVTLKLKVPKLTLRDMIGNRMFVY